ncbi:hypothetical protein WAK64_11685 [Bacillus spongiae]|uniref:Uncharacterized protein n=1 Tax=Bacillus spongiae TaxID=2683610 RepID=A0ABU8HEM3_9BACI
MSEYHKQKSSWLIWIAIFLLGALLLLGIVLALIFGFGFNEQQPNDNFSMDIALTSNDPSNVVYKDVEPQPVSITANFNSLGEQSDACEARITLESQNGDIFEDIEFVPNEVNQAVTLVGKKVTQITVEATVVDADRCILDLEGSTGTD